MSVKRWNITMLGPEGYEIAATVILAPDHDAEVTRLAAELAACQRADKVAHDLLVEESRSWRRVAERLEAELAACRAENERLRDVIDSRERAAGFELVPAPDGSRVLVVEEPPALSSEVQQAFRAAVREIDCINARELAACRELAQRACGYLREVGNDYPGSSCQLWCHSKADECEPDRNNALCPHRANDGDYSKAECVSAGTCECGAAALGEPKP